MKGILRSARARAIGSSKIDVDDGRVEPLFARGFKRGGHATDRADDLTTFVPKDALHRHGDEQLVFHKQDAAPCKPGHVVFPGMDSRATRDIRTPCATARKATIMYQSARRARLLALQNKRPALGGAKGWKRPCAGASEAWR
jgi:hypothetical protein